jgi:hypothetical protein
MRRDQEKILRRLGGFVGGLTGRKSATKISLIASLLWSFGHDDTGSSPREYYQEAILFLVHSLSSLSHDEHQKCLVRE